jgi:EmrB/QacA subfamily drug resistance transporter
MRTADAHQIEARRWATLAVLCLSLLVIVVDSSIVNVALPTLVRKLHASTPSLQWVADAYTLAMAGLLLSLGSLGDRIGRQRTLAGGLIVFGVGSALAGLSGSAGALIASRVVMGVGAAAIMPSTLSILTNVFTVPAERAKAIAMWSAVTGLGVAIGPTLGGWLLEHFSWGSIFTVNLPIVAVALVAGRVFVPPSKNPHPKALDPIGLVTSIGGVVAVVYAIIEAPASGWLSLRTLGVAAAGVAILGAWVVYELRSSHPMVDLRVFRNARFSAASFSVTMIFLALFGWLFLFTQQLQFVLGYDTLQAGVRALPFAVTIGAVAQPAPKLAARVGTKRVVAAGLALMAVGFGLMATSSAATGYGFLLPASLVIAAGMGLAMAPATESIMGALPAAQAGVGSAVNDATRSLGGALGVAVMGSVASSVYASRIGPALVHVPAAVAAQAKRSVGAAVSAGQHAPGTLGQSLVQAARDAFVSGSDHAMIGAMVAAALGSLVAARFLPARPTGAAATPDAVAATMLEPARLAAIR